MVGEKVGALSLNGAISSKSLPKRLQRPTLPMTNTALPVLDSTTFLHSIDGQGYPVSIATKPPTPKLLLPCNADDTIEYTILPSAVATTLDTGANAPDDFDAVNVHDIP